MKMFPWSVGSFYVSGDKVDSTCVLAVRVQFFEKTQILSSLARCKVPSRAMCQKCVYFIEKGFYISEKGVYIFEEDAHLSEERQIVQIMQIRWLDDHNHANKVIR